jgi:hypothetical protein
MLITIPLLTSSECLAIRNGLELLQPHWIDRNPNAPGEVYTIGVATYIDASVEQERARNYFSRIAHYNELLNNTFQHLYYIVRLTLEVYLKAECRYVDTLALPGFHIFLERRLRMLRDLVPHFDHQYLYLPRLLNSDPQSAVSFTLPIVLPQVGGGLDYWDVDTSDFERDIALGKVQAAAEYASFRPSRFLAYEPGTLVLQERLILHRIASTDAVGASDERITLQGHAVKEADHYILYW